MSNNMDNSPGSIRSGFIGFALGFVMGAITALFLTTKTGEELRADIKRIATDIRDKVEKEAGKIKDITKEKYAEILNNVVENYKKIKDLTEKEINFIKKVILEQKDIIK